LQATGTEVTDLGRIGEEWKENKRTLFVKEEKKKKPPSLDKLFVF